jgi:hypothetical protein
LPAKLPENVKSAVIQQWLQGKTRDLIADEAGLSAGGVTNIINEWRRGLSYPIADELRELATSFKKIGITATQSALGFRLATIMINLGVDEREFESFISQIYDNCKKLDLQPGKIVYYIEQLFKFSKDIPFSQIPDYIRQKTNDKSKLEKDIAGLQEKIKQLEQERLVAEDLCKISLENERITSSALKWYSDLKAELKKYRIPIEDLSLFTKTVSGIRQYDYDVDKIIAEFSDLDFLKSQIQLYRDILKELETKSTNLTNNCSSLEEMVNYYNLMLLKHKELESMGFGLKELNRLFHTIHEIAGANNITVEEASVRFYKDIEEQYDDKLGFELKLDKLRSEISTVNRELNSSRAALLAQPLVGPALQRLFYNGIREQDIIELSNLFERYRRDNNDNSSSSSSNIDKQSLMNQLQKYGSIESAIRELTQKINKLNNDAESLEAKKKQLIDRNSRMFSMLGYSKQITYYFKGMIDSLKDEILMRHMVLAYVSYTLNLQFQMIPKLDDALLGEFAPILMAAKLESNRRYHHHHHHANDNNNSTHYDEDDDDIVSSSTSSSSSSTSSSINELQLKAAVARAIQLLINNLKYSNNSDDNISLIEILDTARHALEKEPNHH